MKHLGIVLVALATVLGCAVPVAAAPALAHARVATHGPASTEPAAPDFLDGAPRVSTASDCMASSGWSQRPSACASLPNVTCDGTEFCVHYTLTGANATTTAYVQEVMDSLDYIYSTYKSAGYRMPMADDDADGAPAASKNAVDIYLIDFLTFDNGTFAGDYGYCAPTPPSQKLATSAFCAFDTSYAEKDKSGQSVYTTGSETPEDILHVTAAHEFFHAVQFGYDASADPWIMETSSVWAEDELYSDVNDNRQYLPYGPLGMPGFPMDDYWYEQHNTTLSSGRSDPRDFTPYGDWIFFRYLTEHISKTAGPLPVLVRQIWQQMDSIKRAHPKSSINAVAAALAENHTSLVKQWGAFTAANRAPATYYSEGSAYKAAKPTHATTVSTSNRVRTGHVTMAHLTAATERITGKKVPSGWHLAIRVSAPRARAAVTTAWLTIWKADGKVSDHAITLRKGVGTTSLGFASDAIKRVELTLGNAQTTYKCQTGKMYSCDGTPTGDGLTVNWTATLRR